MNHYKVFNEFFSHAIQVETLTRMDTPRWSFNGGHDSTRFWHMDGLENDPFFSELLFGQIKSKIEENVEVERIYANGQTAGQCGYPHRDDGDLTFLYYPSMDMEGMGGNLVFLDETDEPTNVVGYRSNRAILFPASVKHYAEAPSRLYNGLRISVAWKLRIVK